MPDNNAPVQQTPAQPSPQPLEVSDQSFRRMPSQRRRRLWMLAAQHRGSSLLAPAKPGTVRTQDSGISSMDYVTSREANSPNSEDAGLVSSATAGSSRPRANTTAGLLLCDRREPRVCSEVDTRPRLSIGPPFLSPHASTAAATTGAPNFRTEITIPKGDGEYRQPDYSSHLSTQRYTALCHNYVPDWVRRNWSSAPRPLIPRQRSSVETTGMETSNDWTSMEALNIQHSLYPYNWRLYSGRYGGRFSCPKASVFFEFMPHSECSLNVPCHQHPHHYHHCPACCLDYDSHPHNIPYGQGLGRPLPQYDLPQRHVRRRMLKRMASEPLPPTWTTVSPGVSVAGAGDSADSPLGSTAPPRKRATPKSLVPGPVPVPSTAITIVQPPIPARRAHTASPPAHIYADTRIIDYRASGGFSHEMGTGGAEVYIRTPDTTAAAAAAAAATTSSADLPTTRRPDVRVHRSLRAGTGLIRGRSVDEAFSSQSRGTEPFAGRGEGGALSYQQPYRMTASDFQIAHRPYRAPAAGWEEKQASLLTEDDPICCHGLVPSQAGGHFYRPRLCPHIYEEDESAWKPYEVSVEAAPGRLGSFYPTQRIRK
ncbi:hypothetical protein AAHC03_019460 [Spirometra sp. Aus1]